jgi:hypothetical protein
VEELLSQRSPILITNPQASFVLVEQVLPLAGVLRPLEQPMSLEEEVIHRLQTNLAVELS